MRVLTVNAGSSSVKVSVLDGDIVMNTAHLEGSGAGILPALGRLVDRYRPEATVHRIVHGGAQFHEPLLVDGRTEEALLHLADLAPLHNPPALTLLDQVQRLAPTAATVACFDTGFFATLPEVAATYAVPEWWRSRLGIRRFGFHGLSHSWVSSVVPDLVGQPGSELRVVSAHLGAGASLAAISGGRPVDTTMGFTPLDGLVMATRCGSLDPGVITHLLRTGAADAASIDQTLEHRSGLLGLAGTADLAEVIDGAGAGEDRALLAYGVYLHRLRGAVAAMAAAMDGFDVLCFTGGAGEASAAMRADVCRGLGFLGCEVHSEANHGTGDRLISAQATPAVAVVHAREDLVMARQATALLQGRHP